MFWGGVQALTGHRHRRLHALITHDVAVYAAHLPPTSIRRSATTRFSPGWN
jgi:putative NIF3 family GTP cyclohydrolase 1 type 2